ncbi:NADP-dependent oxidoreductase domain-containing protein [Mycena albidolilacea]|uniref:NADP-dependent oxidoreductase domain-containing protein n=1 Tax=Mycena albidolilacea TaxID=1033008 RepID=A0AAD7F5Z0_9AGAR|nr:NADP-dependent oxidoreductase domain-containing protein [Mycena albidolilacea]
MASPPKMEYVRLGTSGLKVSKIILGCMSYGDPNWSGNWVLAEEEAVKHIKAAYDAGINAFDTANSYSNGLSEEVLGHAIKKHNLPREEIVVMTKIFLAVSKNTTEVLYGDADLDLKGYVNQYGLSRKVNVQFFSFFCCPGLTRVQHIFDAVKHSLRRLGLDYIDVLQCHRFDPNTPIEETMQALHDVVKAGYARYIGMSSCYAWQFHAMQNYAITHNLTPFISMQNQYSLVYREEEREMFPTLKHFGVGAIPWSPLSRGALSRPLSQQTKRGESDALSANFYTQSAASQAIVNRVEEIAKKRGISMAQVAIAWVLSKDGVSAPIVGTTSLANLTDIIGAIHVQLSGAEIKYLEEPYQPMPIFGH